MVDGMMTNHTHTVTMIIMRCTFVFTHVQHIHADIPRSIHVCMPLHRPTCTYTPFAGAFVVGVAVDGADVPIVEGI